MGLPPTLVHPHSYQGLGQALRPPLAAGPRAREQTNRAPCPPAPTRLRLAHGGRVKAVTAPTVSAADVLFLVTTVSFNHIHEDFGTRSESQGPVPAVTAGRRVSAIVVIRDPPSERAAALRPS